MHRAPRSCAALALAAVLALAGCGGDGDKSTEELEDEVSEQLVDGGLDAEAADCMAAVIVDEIGAEELQDVDFGAEEPPAELQEQIGAASQRALEECDLGSDEE